MPMTDRDAVKQVFEQWALYDAVVRHDYMRHAELTRAMAAWAESFGRPLRVVDLGCGDAGLATSGFRSANVEGYWGVDLSESSVERARGRLGIWPGRAEVACGIGSTARARGVDQGCRFRGAERARGARGCCLF